MATDVGGVRDYLSHECASFVQRADPEGIANAVESLLADGPGRRRMSTAARTRAMRFEWGTVADELVAAYERLR